MLSSGCAPGGRTRRREVKGGRGGSLGANKGQGKVNNDGGGCGHSNWIQICLELVPVTRVDGTSELMSMTLGVGQRLVVEGLGTLGRVCAGFFLSNLF